MEAVVSRMKTVVNGGPKDAHLRFVAVSATIPNVEDVSLNSVWRQADSVKVDICMKYVF